MVPVIKTSPLLILIRGIPGSGKSTLAKLIAETLPADHWEANMFMVDKDGNYSFDPARLHEVHAKCLIHTNESLHCGRNAVVSNPFIRLWELSRYLDLGYPVKIIERPLVVHNNTHNVPEDTIYRMRSTFESVLNP